MPFYPDIKNFKTKDERERTASNLLALRDRLQDEIPGRTVNQTLLLGTWNLRNFDDNRFKHGPRIPESFYYIAEIISKFDIVALQEITRDIRPLKKILNILGRNWKFLITDVTEGPSGNTERIAFVYDTNKISFQNLAGEIVLPRSSLVGEKDQFARTPYIAAFQSGWFKFQLCSVHIYYGASSGEKLEKRKEEIKKIAKFLAKRSEEEEYNYILLGDFNIISPVHETMEALTKNGFIVPDKLRKPSNIDRTKFYDQIAFRVKEGELRLGDNKNGAGVFDFFQVVFRENADYNEFAEYMKRNDNDNLPGKNKFDYDKDGNPRDDESKREYYQEWRTFQMSDHLIMWVELKIDFSKEYLESLKQ
jgi:exonuclease III